MKHFLKILCAALGLLVASEAAFADWGSLKYGGWQPWWNPFKKNRCATPEEQRLQKFWHDYYDAMRRYYGMLDNIDWVAYYKNHGYQINTAGCMPGMPGCGPQRVQFAPVFVSPSMQWAIPSNGCLQGPPASAGLPMGLPMGGMPPMMGGMPMGMPGMAGMPGGMGGMPPGMPGPGMMPAAYPGAGMPGQ